MKCEHQPKGLIVAFEKLCRFCGVIIEYVPCPACDGECYVRGQYPTECKACMGTGIKKWEEVK